MQCFIDKTGTGNITEIHMAKDEKIEIIAV